MNFFFIGISLTWLDDCCHFSDIAGYNIFASYAQAIEDQGFHIVYNPQGDCSCQFAALSHQIRKLGIHRFPKTIRKEIVEYLERNPYDSDGFPLLEH